MLGYEHVDTPVGTEEGHPQGHPTAVVDARKTKVLEDEGEAGASRDSVFSTAVASAREDHSQDDGLRADVLAVVALILIVAGVGLFMTLGSGGTSSETKVPAQTDEAETTSKTEPAATLDSQLARQQRAAVREARTQGRRALEAASSVAAKAPAAKTPAKTRPANTEPDEAHEEEQPQRPRKLEFTY